MRPTQARLFPLFLLLLFVLFGAGSRSFGERSRWVPFGCGGLGAALCLVLMVKKEETTSAEPGSGAWRAELTLLVVAGAGALGGMLAAAPAAYLFYALVSEGRSWRNALAAAVVSTVLVYFLFGVLLEVPLLRNLP